MPGVGYGVEEAFESGRTTAIFGRSAAFAIDISGILGFALPGLDLFDGDDMFPIVAHVVGIEELTNAAVEQGTELGVFGGRSEEHTSELQSLMRISYAVFCLKKK